MNNVLEIIAGDIRMLEHNIAIDKFRADRFNRDAKKILDNLWNDELYLDELKKGICFELFIMSLHMTPRGYIKYASVFWGLL